MELKKLIKNLAVKEIKGDILLDIKDIKNDSNYITKNALYICIKGEDFDGHDFIRQAERFGAVAIVSERVLDTSLTQIIVEDSRTAMSLIASNFYGRPADKLRIIGVTGTNGKTTTAHLIKRIMDKAGCKCGVIGTLGIFYDGIEIEPSLTTPDPLELHRIFADMLKHGITDVVMEVSAHALALKKLEGIKFHVGIFTNFTRDHLDFFGDMESYKRAKKEFFKPNRCNYILSNSDDCLGVDIINNCDNVISYGIENPADVFAIKIKERNNGTNFVINLFDCIFDVEVNLIGRFNVYNALAAVSACTLSGVTTELAVSGLNGTNNVSGRMELVCDKGYSVYVDYAHTPDGLEKALNVLKPLTKNKLICVFGCGGNRDKGKREKMGKISGELADFTVITSDNPRYEEPMEIIQDIERGILQNTKNYILVQDRKDGILYALNLARQGDTVLIAGKGSEKYQEILGIKHLFNDKDTVRELLGGKR